MFHHLNLNDPYKEPKAPTQCWRYICPNVEAHICERDLIHHRSSSGKINMANLQNKQPQLSQQLPTVQPGILQEITRTLHILHFSLYKVFILKQLHASYHMNQKYEYRWQHSHIHKRRTSHSKQKAKRTEQLIIIIRRNCNPKVQGNGPSNMHRKEIRTSQLKRIIKISWVDKWYNIQLLGASPSLSYNG